MVVGAVPDDPIQVRPRGQREQSSDTEIVLLVVT
jgi:hypothetical protein